LKKGKILELNPSTLEYEPRKKLKTPSTEIAKQQKGTRAKLQTLIYSDDRAGRLLWNITAPTLIYCAELLTEIADNILSIDEAMKWGFGWEQGPFESWDAIGVQKSVTLMEEIGLTVPNWIKDMLNAGNSTFYKEENGTVYYYDAGEYKPIKQNGKNMNLKLLKKQNGVIKKNSGASLIDVGDGVALLEFHSQNNAIGLDILQMINSSIDEVEKNYKGLVIANQGKNFCVGAHVGLMLMEAQDENFDELDFVIRKFQQTMMRIKYSFKPVVVAPHGMTLGGGAEVCLPAARIQSSPESYIGLVEAGVGLIPGGGGSKELYMKLLNSLPSGVEVDLQNIANKVFETVAMAKTSTSAKEARELGFLNNLDRISRNQDHRIYDAKQFILNLHEADYRPPVRRKVPVVGETGYATMLLGAQNFHLSGFISKYDLHIASKLAFVLAGGKVPFGTEVDEQYLLDLEREAFLSLISEPKTQQRMQYMLTKGKPLRN
jgi:3-hydroxyacyl-CoA dehydrogenase